MDILVIIWIVVFFGGRILTSVARREQRQDFQRTTPISTDELELKSVTTRSKVNSSTQPQQKRNAGAQPKRNDSARLRQEMTQQLKTQAARGQRTSNVKDYVKKMSGSQSKQLDLLNEEAVSTRRQKVQKESNTMSTGIYEEIDWDNFEADFMANSEWAEDNAQEELMRTVRDASTKAVKSLKISAKPAQEVRDLLRPESIQQAILLSEILGEPKALRHRTKC